MAERYAPEFFVGRDDLLARVVDWADDPNPDFRVWSIVGPPGVGKSYFVNRAREQLNQAQDRPVLWIDLNRDLSIRGNDPDMTTAAGQATWLQAAVDRARQQCGDVRMYDGDVPFEAMLDTLVADLCDRCHQLRATILLVDGFEEINDKQREELEERVLARFVRRGCTRILLSRRDETRFLIPALKWKEGIEWLPVMEDDEADQQIATRLELWDRRPRRMGQTGRLADPVPIPANILELLQLDDLAPPYHWDHPGINTYLLERAIAHWRASDKSYLDIQDIYTCIADITAIAEVQLSTNEFNLLAKLADAMQLPEEWTEGDLMRQLKIPIDDKALAELFRRGIVINIENTPRYRIADGLCDLVHAWRRLSNLDW